MMIKLKSTNLRPLDDEDNNNTIIDEFMQRSPPIPDEKLLPLLEASVRRHRTEVTTDRPDLLRRLQFYESLAGKLRRAAANCIEQQQQQSLLSDSDYCLPCGAGLELLTGNFAVLMRMMYPTCWGNASMDLRYVDIGLKGDGFTECAICHDVLAATEGGTGDSGDGGDASSSSSSSSSQALVTLPCLHIFHETCVVRWLNSETGSRSWNCPTCRRPVPDDMSTYRIRYDEQVQRRVDEFPLSGFCTKCMIMNMENHRNEELGVDDGQGGVRVGPFSVRPGS